MTFAEMDAMERAEAERRMGMFVWLLVLALLYASAVLYAAWQVLA